MSYVASCNGFTKLLSEGHSTTILFQPKLVHQSRELFQAKAFGA